MDGTMLCIMDEPKLYQYTTHIYLLLLAIGSNITLFIIPSFYQLLPLGYGQN